MKLGDTFRKFTEITGIHYLVKLFSKITGIDCGCDKRQEKWNNIKFDRNG